MKTFQNAKLRHGPALARAVAGGVLLATSVAACSAEDILAVDDPDVVTLQSLTTREALPAVRAAVIGDFQVAYSGSSGNEGIAQMTALFSDELQNSESFPTRIEVDMRNMQEVNSTLLGTYRQLHRARATAAVASARYAELDPSNPSWGEVLALGGYSYVAFAENYCSGVPFSNVNISTGEFTYGAPETTQQMLQQAIARFDSAIAIAGPNSTQGRLARIGKARAHLGLGQYATAAATVGGGAGSEIPSTFAYDIEASENSGRQNNGFFNYSQLGKRFTIFGQSTDNAREGINGLPYRTDGLVGSLNADPRLMVYRPAGGAGNGFTASVPLFVSSKYPDRRASFRLASGVEARLIEAEFALNSGDLATFLAKLNEARANARTFAAANQPGATRPAAPAPLTVADVPATQQGRVDLLFKERAYHLFLEGHRTGDLRRLIRQYGRTEDTVFPTGNYFRGGVYGDDVNFPIPFEERNNPSFTGCIDRNA